MVFLILYISAICSRALSLEIILFVPFRVSNNSLLIGASLLLHSSKLSVIDVSKAFQLCKYGI